MSRTKHTRQRIPRTFRLPREIVQVLELAVSRNNAASMTAVLVGLVADAVADGRLPKPASVEDARQLRFL